MAMIALHPLQVGLECVKRAADHGKDLSRSGLDITPKWVDIQIDIITSA
jgi:hypothetical protein